LIDHISFLGFPGSPLFPIYWTKISPLQCKCLVIFYLFDEGYEFSIPFWRIPWELSISSGFFEIFGICPFIPDLDVILYEWTDIGLTRDKPEKFMDDSSHEDLLGSKKWKRTREIKSHLMTKNRTSSDTSTIAPIYTSIENFLKEIEILLFSMHKEINKKLHIFVEFGISQKQEVQGRKIFSKGVYIRVND
jgi:hypothetical protein